MCGLCGVLGPELKEDHWRIFQNLMIVSTIRGADGSGIAAVPLKAGADVEVLRSEGCAADLVTGAEYWKMRKGKWTCFMGHARFPTRGTYDMKDVHPHVCGPIVGMHNGTMLRVNGRLLKQADNDSRLLFQSIMHTGIDNTIKLSHGAYALSYLTKTTDTLSFLRNKARPLSFARIEGQPEMYWASEVSFLTMILGREFPGRKILTYHLGEDTFMSFRLHGNQAGVKVLDHRKIESTKEKEIETAEKVSIIHMRPTKSGHFVTEPEMQVILARGCSYCSGTDASMAHVVQKQVAWVDKEEFICHECLSYDSIARDYARSCGCDQLPPMKTERQGLH